MVTICSFTLTTESKSKISPTVFLMAISYSSSIHEIIVHGFNSVIFCRSHFDRMVFIMRKVKVRIYQSNVNSNFSLKTKTKVGNMSLLTCKILFCITFFLSVCTFYEYDHRIFNTYVIHQEEAVVFGSFTFRQV